MRRFLNLQAPKRNFRCEPRVKCSLPQALQDDDYIYVVLPFCTRGELFSVVSAHRGLSEDAARPIFRGLLAGIAFLHNLQICHR